VPGTQKARRFAHFLTHEKDLRASPKIMEDIKRYHTDIKRVLGDEAPEFDQFLQLYGKVIINDFELSQRENRESIGMGPQLPTERLGRIRREQVGSEEQVRPRET